MVDSFNACDCRRGRAGLVERWEESIEGKREQHIFRVLLQRNC